jgi:hypothetical protein
MCNASLLIVRISKSNGGKGLFSVGMAHFVRQSEAPPFRDGFVYDTPLKNFPSF